MTDSVHVVCPHCDTINRASLERGGGRCGHCRGALFEGHPVALDDERFERHLQRNDIPMLVDFWADWCGPCHAMAPVYEQAAGRLEPHVRLAKVDTERNRSLASRMGMRGIPTLILFKGGREVARRSGAQDLQSLLDWVRQHV